MKFNKEQQKTIRESLKNFKIGDNVIDFLKEVESNLKITNEQKNEIRIEEKNKGKIIGYNINTFTPIRKK